MVIHWSRQAIRSLYDIYNFYLPKAGKETARRIVTEIREETRYLLIFPELGSKESGLGKHTDYRYIVKHHCKIFYTLSEKRILIAFVWDTRRNPNTLKTILKE